MEFSPSTAMAWLDHADGLLQQHDLCYGHGKNDSRDEAAALITYALNISPQDPESALHVELNEQQQQRLKHCFQQRIEERLPTPYITRQVYFAHHPFYIDQRAIIPRSPMAEIIEDQFFPWFEPSPNPSVRLLDLCCGSGCLGIASKLHCEFISHVYLSDISREALEVAAINVQRHTLEKNVTLLQGDLFDSLKNNKTLENERFDVILCNPPYVDLQTMACLPQEYLHEPRIALDGRVNSDSSVQDGLELVGKIMQDSKKYLTLNGRLFLEVGMSKDAFEAQYCHLNPIEIALRGDACGLYVIAAEDL